MSDIELKDLSKRSHAPATDDDAAEFQALGTLRDAESVVYWAYTAAAV